MIRRNNNALIVILGVVLIATALLVSLFENRRTDNPAGWIGRTEYDVRASLGEPVHTNYAEDGSLELTFRQVSFGGHIIDYWRVVMREGVVVRVDSWSK